MTKTQQFENLWGMYIEKLARIDELKNAGRYGYQLRMPIKAKHIAFRKLKAWCTENGVECPGN